MQVERPPSNHQFPSDRQGLQTQFYIGGWWIYANEYESLYIKSNLFGLNDNDMKFLPGEAILVNEYNKIY